jgi:hypothetical protein
VAAAGVVHQNPADHLRRNPEEVRTVLPPHTALIDETDKCLVDKRGALQGVVRPFFAEVASRKPPQLAVNERRELLECRLVAVAPVDEQFCDLLG